jgi:hypothetical protein
MTLTFCWDVSAADWIVRRDVPWERLVGFGPAGFDSYARLRFLPDPVRPGQSENDVDGDWFTDQLPTLWQVLATNTATPSDCYFCVWEGFGHTEAASDDAVYLDDDDAVAEHGRTGRPGWAPAPVPVGPPSTPPVPKVVVPHRAYWLFRGPLADLGSWDTAQEWPGPARLDQAEPAFVWPADHAWCVAQDVDPHWAGIGGTTTLITRLTADPRLDAVPADPAEDQPLYR